MSVHEHEHKIRRRRRPPFEREGRIPCEEAISSGDLGLAITTTACLRLHRLPWSNVGFCMNELRRNRVNWKQLRRFLHVAPSSSSSSSAATLNNIKKRIVSILCVYKNRVKFGEKLQFTSCDLRSHKKESPVRGSTAELTQVPKGIMADVAKLAGFGWRNSKTGPSCNGSSARRSRPGIVADMLVRSCVGWMSRDVTAALALLWIRPWANSSFGLMFSSWWFARLLHVRPNWW